MRVMHVDPEEAVQIHLDLGARRSVAIHWGTFDDLTDESLYEPPQRLRAALAARGLSNDAFWVLKHGETRPLDAIRESLPSAHGPPPGTGYRADAALIP